MATLFLVGIGAALLYGVRRSLQAVANAWRASDPVRENQRRAHEAAAMQRLRLLDQERQRHNVLARRLQLALFQIGQSPDFRRAASCALQARTIPVAFRRRQFQRFRPLLVQHFATRLAAGADIEQLATTLKSLVQALGLAAFEADYIRVEVEGRERALPRPEPTYAQRLDTIRRHHEERLAALRSLPGVDDETCEQLNEAEETRFREELLRLSQNPSPP